ncbi:hypothetical protein B0H10DRAFT_2301169, partial [Mycena sp. CBHHK59/15]
MDLVRVLFRILLIIFLLLLFSLRLAELSSTKSLSLSGHVRPMSKELTNPQLFTCNRYDHYKCNICPGSSFTVLSRARAHEDSVSHALLVRQLDRPEDPALVSSPQHHDGVESLHPGSPLPGSSPGLFQVETTSVHGPALPSDDEDQIYDDFSGELAYNRPSSDDEDNGYYDQEDDFSLYHDPHPPSDGPITYNSDGPIAYDCPESDGLFMEREENLDRAKE